MLNNRARHGELKKLVNFRKLGREIKRKNHIGRKHGMMLLSEMKVA